MKAAKQFCFVLVIALPVVIGLEYVPAMTSGIKFVLGFGVGGIAMLVALRIWR